MNTYAYGNHRDHRDDGCHIVLAPAAALLAVLTALAVRLVRR